MIKIAFWKKESGNYMSASQGLTQEQVSFLQSLKVGDRLIVMQNQKFSENSPEMSLMQYQGKKEKSDNYV